MVLILLELTFQCGKEQYRSDNTCSMYFEVGKIGYYGMHN